MAKKISQKRLNQMALGGAKVKRKSSPVPSAEEVRAAAPPPIPPNPIPQDNSVPFASMAASMAAINSQLAETVENNTRVIEQFRKDAAAKLAENPKRQPWRAKVKRDRNKLIDYVDLIPVEFKQ